MGPRAQLALVNLDSPSSRQNKEKLVGRFFFLLFSENNGAAIAIISWRFVGWGAL